MVTLMNLRRLLACLILSSIGVLAPMPFAMSQTQDLDSEGPKNGATCKKIWESSMQHYKALAKFLPSNFTIREQLPTHQIIRMENDGCDRLETVDLFQKVASLHSQKIAVMLPLGRWSPSLQGALINKIRSYMATQGLDPHKQVVILDTGGSVQTMQTQLAQLVFTQHITAIVGGLTIAEAPVLTKWAAQLRIPTIILNKKLAPPRNRFVFRIGPDQKDLANSLASYAESKGFKRIAVMMPNSTRDGTIADAMTANGRIEIVGPFVYNPHDYGSIDHTFKRLFHLNDEDRKQELLDLITEFKEKAKEEGVGFDAKGLMLPPLVDVDALVILDHFKNVRHLAKSLHFYGVKGLPLLGIPKWRAPELVDQEEENLRGAVFVDYVGSYRELPYGIEAPIVGDENFIEGLSASRVDLELVITHGVAAAASAIKGTRAPRYTLYRRIEAASPEDKAFFGQNTFFRGDHEGHWPTFLYSVQNGKITSLGRNIGRKTSPQVKKRPL